MIRIGIKSAKFLLIAAIAYAFVHLLVFYVWAPITSPLTAARLKAQNQKETKDFIIFLGEKVDLEVGDELLRSKRLEHLKPSVTTTTTTRTTTNTRRVSRKNLTCIKHRTFLTTRTRCNQKFPVLILVLSRPLNFENRKVIRQTWGTDHQMNKTWKTMFLLGQAQHPTENRYLTTEAAIHGDLVQGSQTDSYDNLTLKVEMGLEWAVSYCDFDFLLKSDDDVFIDPFRLIDYLRRPQTPKKWLYLGNVKNRSKARRKGKWALAFKEYPRTVLPRFCLGPAYVLSHDFVRAIVDLFDPRHPLRLEDVYMGTLAKHLGVTPRRHRGFITNRFNGQCLLYPNLIALHEASVNCIVKLFDKALEQRFRQIINPEKLRQA